jgi:predicted ATPase with chaperone activity
LILKLLLQRGAVAGRAIGDHLGLAFAAIEPLLGRLKTDQLVVYRGASALGDYCYQLTEKGVAAAQRALAQGSYFGAVPVPFEDYLASVQEQSIRRHRPRMADILPVFADMELDPMLLNQLGQALNAGKGFFLYGTPGNGKTSIAERVSEVFGQFIWIPRTLVVDGHLIRLFDPCAHEEAPVESTSQRPIDRRWVRIRRPSIVVGGELVFESLDLALNTETGVSEAPFQLKSNCGTLVIDDFGRQRISTVELLNRWIVPLDRGHDYLHLPGGKSLRVPFDQILVFSTNLQPRDLVDEAFLRRIPYKIEVRDPTEDEFHKLLVQYAAKFEVAYQRAACEYLVDRHFRQAGRVLRRCHARDLVAQVHHFCRFNELAPALLPKNFDMAVMNYFALSEA